MTEKKSPIKKRVEKGITPTVKTIFSKYTVGDIIDSVADLKAHAILSWIQTKKIKHQKTLIIGVYLTGAKIANELVKSSPVTVIDIYPHLQGFLDPEVSFKESVFELEPELEHSPNYDLVIDTTGLGGLSSQEMNHLINHLNENCSFLAENPCSGGSDDAIKSMDQTRTRLEYFNAVHRGFLFTEGLNSKTSGTMTLALDVLRHSMADALKKEGVLYAVSSLDFYERILFKEKNIDSFLEAIQQPALVISSLKTIDSDQIIKENLDKISSSVHDYSE